MYWPWNLAFSLSFCWSNDLKKFSGLSVQQEIKLPSPKWYFESGSSYKYVFSLSHCEMFWKNFLKILPLQSLALFCNHFEELQTVLFEVQLIINNTPLTYFYPNTIETWLTPYHLLFGGQLLYSSNIKSTVVRNVTILSSTTDKINPISYHILDRWRHEFTSDTTNIEIKYRLSKS